MKSEEVVPFQNDWLNRRIMPIIKMSPFSILEMETVMEKLHRKNREGKKQFGKAWKSITLKSIEDLALANGEKVQEKVLTLGTFAKTWAPVAKLKQKKATASS